MRVKLNQIIYLPELRMHEEAAGKAVGWGMWVGQQTEGSIIVSRQEE